MIRSALALVLVAGVASPAFAQTAMERLSGFVTSVNDKITQYDEGTGKAFVYYGGKTVKYSLIAVGAAYVTTQTPKNVVRGVAEEAVTNPTAFAKLRRFFTYDTTARIGKTLRTNGLSTWVLDAAAIPVAAGVGSIAIGAAIFVFEHLYYNTIGHPDQTASNELAQVLALPVAQQIELASANPELAAVYEQLDSALELVNLAK